MRKFLFITTLLFFYFTVSSQKYNKDTLLSIARNKNIDDSIRNSAFESLTRYYIYKNTDSALNYLENIKHKKDTGYWMLRYNALKGIIYRKKGKIITAEEALKKALSWYKIDNYPKTKTIILTGLGNIYLNKNNYGEALKYYLKVKEITTKLKDSVRLPILYSNIGSVYLKTGDKKNAKLYYKNGLKIARDTDIKRNIALLAGNLAIIYRDEKNYKKSLKYYQLSLSQMRLTGNTGGELQILGSIASLYEKKGMVNKAYLYTDSALFLAKINKFSGKLSELKIKKANILLRDKKYKQAEDICKGIYQISIKNNQPKNMIDGCGCIAEALYGQKKLSEAVKYFRRYNAIKDSIYIKYDLARTNDIKTQFHLRELRIKDSLNHIQKIKIKELRIAKQKEKNQRTRAYLIFFIITGAILGFAFLIVTRLFRQKKQANKIINLQKSEIIDSINYAKRIQKAILPSKKDIDRLLPENFIIYIPKNIISGDFYWLKEPSNNIILLAVADCTGHGVPGAMVSVVCNNSLNQSVREFKLTDPADILNKTREIVIAEFEKSNEYVNDGMDIALCKLEKNTLHYAGANNPLWLIRNNSNKIEIFYPEKQPIGKFEHKTPYKSHKIELNKGDQIYLFSDGYADQFGGKHNKKLKSKNLKSLILKIKNKTPKEQEQILHEEFNNWKSGFEQLDDVCIWGIKF